MTISARRSVLSDVEYLFGLPGTARLLQAVIALDDRGLAWTSAARHLERDAIRGALAGVIALEVLRRSSGAYRDGDALTDEQVDVAVVQLVDREKRQTLLWRLTEEVVDCLDQLAGSLLRGEGVAGVDDGGHEDSPSVGRSEGGSSAVVGAAALDTSSAGVPTVGVPTDAPAEPSAAGASVVPVCLLREREEQRALLRGDLYAIVRSAGGLHTDELAERLLEAGWRRS